MKILLTGKHGQVGFELRRALSVLGEVLAVDQHECDLTDEQAIRQLVRDFPPDVIVNPAAYTAVDKAESDQDTAFAVNAKAPGVFGEEAAKLGAWVIHFSTDYVFDGEKSGAYVETDATSPQSVYGASKLAGEQALAASGAKHIILRTCWVLGAHGGNFAKTMLRLAKERDRLTVVADQFGAPTSAALLADITAHVIQRVRTQANSESLAGVYHAVAGGVTNWHEYACYVIERARATGHAIQVAPEAVLPIPSHEYPVPAKRPKNSRLNAEKLCQTFGLHLPTWQSGVDHILDQIL